MNDAMLTKRRQKEIASLRRRKGRSDQQAYLVEGIRLVVAAVDAGAPVVELVVSHETSEDPRARAVLAKLDVPVSMVSSRQFGTMSDVESDQGILAVVRLPELSDRVPRGARSVLALDGVQDPGNVGVLIRTAAWFGVDTVVAGPGTADPFGPKVVRASMGGLWDVRFVATGDLAATLTRAREDGLLCYGATLEGTSVRRWKPVERSVLVLGSEAHGISDAVVTLLDEQITISSGSPDTGKQRGVESLNVATAGAVMMYHWTGRP